MCSFGAATSIGLFSLQLILLFVYIHCNNLKKASSQIPTLNNGSIIASTNVDKASVLNEVLSQNFNSTVPPLTEADSQTFSVNSSAELPENMFCSEDEVLGLLLAIDTNKASGPDGISGTMLKNIAHTISPLVTRLFNLSIKTGKVPHQWKISSVVPIPKASPNTDNPRNYRPISLLPVISKLLERHIHSVVYNHLTENNLLAKDQWGFTAGKSTVTALISTFNEILQMLESGANRHQYKIIWLNKQGGGGGGGGGHFCPWNQDS